MEHVGQDVVMVIDLFTSDICKVTIIESESSRIINYTKHFKFDLKIDYRGELKSYTQGGRLKY